MRPHTLAARTKERRPHAVDAQGYLSCKGVIIARKIVRVIGKDGTEMAVYPVVIEADDRRSIIEEVMLCMIEDGIDGSQAGGFQVEDAN